MSIYEEIEDENVLDDNRDRAFEALLPKLIKQVEDEYDAFKSASLQKTPEELFYGADLISDMGDILDMLQGARRSRNK